MRHLGPSSPKRFLAIGRLGPLSVDQARDKAKAALGAVSLGQDPSFDLQKGRMEQTFRAIVELFLSQHVRKKRKAATGADYASLLNSYALPVFGNRKLTDVTRADVSTLHGDLHAKPYQANRLVAVIGSLYSFAEKRELVPEHFNPARRTEKFKEDRRERFLSMVELERLEAAIEEGETIAIPWVIDGEEPLSSTSQKQRTGSLSERRNWPPPSAC